MNETRKEAIVEQIKRDYRGPDGGRMYEMIQELEEYIFRKYRRREVPSCGRSS